MATPASLNTVMEYVALKMLLLPSKYLKIYVSNGRYLDRPGSQGTQTMPPARFHKGGSL